MGLYSLQCAYEAVLTKASDPLICVLESQILTHLEFFFALLVDLFKCKIDCEKAFECVYYDQFIETLEEHPIDSTALKLIKNIFLEPNGERKTGTERINDVKIKRGVRQGSFLSLKHFNLRTKETFQKADDLLGVT